jgi:predicted dehydrogenase
MKIIVVEGIGDIVSKPTGYGPALHKLKIDIPSLRIIFCDISKGWTTSIAKDRRKTIKDLKKWGAEFLDKSKKDELKEYHDLLHAKVDAVIIATPDSTHITLARHWLQGDCERIFIEKPITNNPEEVQQWLTSNLYDNEDDLNRIVAFDHYRPRVHAHLAHKDTLWFVLSDTGRVKKFKFYFLEDHSGTDTKYLDAELERGREIEDRNGPIENEGRMAALASGLILDLMPHIIAVLEYFGEPESIQLKEIRPAIYTGVDYDYNSHAEINNETFAAIKFTFTEDSGSQAEGEAYIGKGIRGAEKFPEMMGNVKILVIEGETDCKLEFNFRQHTVSKIINGVKQTPFLYLERDPYYFLLRDIAFKPDKGIRVSLSVEMAAIILEKLIEMKSKVNTELLPTYKLGNKEGDLPPMLEDLLEGGSQEVPPLYCN